jgi:hypothetical protein
VELARASAQLVQFLLVTASMSSMLTNVLIVALVQLLAQAKQFIQESND